MDVPLLKSSSSPSLSKLWFPTGSKKEFIGLLEIFFPCLFTNLFRFLNPLISVIMCGHLTKLEFDSALLAISIINIFGGCIDLGFSTSFDTLFSQIYGSKNKKNMGALLQRAIIITTLLYLVLACFHLNIEPLLILCRQDPLISELTTVYLTIYLPGLFFDFQFLTISRYLQNQNIVYPMMLSSLFSNVFNVICQYVCLFVYGYGIRTSALILTMSTFTMFTLQLGYVLISKVYRPTWDGFGWRKALENWKIIFLLGIPGIFMISLKGWNFEIITFVAGALSDVQLGAHGIALQIASLAFMLSIGLGVSVTIRVGQYLGSREIDRLKTFLRIATIMSVMLALSTCIVIYCFKDNIVKIYSNNEEIQKEASALLVYISFFQIIDVFAFINAGILKSCGRQGLGALIMFVCDYVLGTPIGIILVLRAKMNITGMWIGMIVSVFLEFIIFIYLVCRIDWLAECNKAQKNAECFEDSHRRDHQPLISERIDYVKDYYLATTEHLIKDTVEETTTEYELRGKLTFTRTVRLRLLAITIVLLLFSWSILLRVYLPKTLYLPCLPRNNLTIILYSANMDMLCKNASIGILSN